MNSKMELSEAITELPKLNFGVLLALISPVIAYFGVMEPVKSNYRLRKDFKIQNTMTADLPEDVIRKFDDLDEQEILKKQFGNIIINFVKTIKEKIPEVNMSILINNLNTLEVIVNDIKCNNARSVAGQYNPLDNTIELSKENSEMVIYHELFHAITAIFKESKDVVYCGFRQTKADGSQIIGESLNEGYTQYLNEKYFGYNKSFESAYDYEIAIAKTLERIVGKDLMQSLYFNADLNGLVSHLKKYASEEDIYRFIDTLDLLKEHRHDSYLVASSKDLMLKGFKFINYFLITTSFRKVIMDNKERQLSGEAILKMTMPFLTTIPESVELKRKTYNISSDELIKNALELVLSEYDLTDYETPNKKL